MKTHTGTPTQERNVGTCDSNRQIPKGHVGARSPNVPLLLSPNPPKGVVEMAEQGIRDLEERLSW